ncbi:MAG: hypothetical protein R2809_04800 [Flavobacteriales bacterium]
MKKDVEDFMQTNGFVCVKSTVNNVAGDQLYVNTNTIGADKIADVLRLVKKQQRNKK